MKVIDEKGRLFGKVNVIDFLVVLFIFSLVPMFYFGYKIAHQKEEERQQLKRETARQEAARQETQRQEEERRKEFIELDVDCTLIKLKPEIVKIISVGDKAFNQYGEQIGEIIRLGEFSPYTYMLNVGAGRKIKKEPQDLKQVSATLRIKAQIIENTNLYYQGRQVLQNEIIEFKTDKYSIPAILTFKDIDIAPEIIAIESRLTTLETNVANILQMVYDLKAKLQGISQKMNNKNK